MVNIVQNVIDMVDLIGGVASNGPISALLVLLGALLIGFSSLVMAYLTAGAVVDLLIPDSVGQPPAQRR